jgi:hypothetical protein
LTVITEGDFGRIVGCNGDMMRGKVPSRYLGQPNAL